MNIYLTLFKEFLEIDTNNTDYDILLNRSLDSAVGYIDTMFNIKLFKTIDEVLLLSGNDLKVLRLEIAPILSITELKEEGVLIDPSEYYFKYNKLFYKEDTFPEGFNNIEVKLTYGYDNTDIPKDLLFALLKVAEKFYTDASQNKESVTEFQSMGEKVKFRNSFPSEAVGILSKYKIDIL